jgi:hypothetical protein
MTEGPVQGTTPSGTKFTAKSVQHLTLAGQPKGWAVFIDGEEVDEFVALADESEADVRLKATNCALRWEQAASG